MKRNILLGITGSIAGYKTPELCRLLQKAGFQLKVVLTASGKEFVSPLTLKTLTQDQVYIQDSLVDISQDALTHIDLARWADFILIAPTTANFMAKLSTGIADELLSSICLATQAPIVLAPSMNMHMWANRATQSNYELLKTRGISFLGPEQGEQACGDVGAGRLIELSKIVDYFVDLSNIKPIWAKKHIMVTAGPTIEPIDPVRFISNYSSGKMGYALAIAAKKMGAKVTLISGPVSLSPPAGVDFIAITTAQEMLDAITSQIATVDVFIGAAAVADWHILESNPQKIKNKDKTLHLELVPNPDIIASVASFAHRPFMVGFAAETENLKVHAQQKLQNKNLDMVVANDVSQKGIGFSSEENAVTILGRTHEVEFSKMKKSDLAYLILEQIYKEYTAK